LDRPREGDKAMMSLVPIIVPAPGLEGRRGRTGHPPLRGVPVCPLSPPHLEGSVRAEVAHHNRSRASHRSSRGDVPSGEDGWLKTHAPMRAPECRLGSWRAGLEHDGGWSWRCGTFTSRPGCTFRCILLIRSTRAGEETPPAPGLVSGPPPPLTPSAGNSRPGSRQARSKSQLYFTRGG
jgi:hypothetical protein